MSSSTTSLPSASTATSMSRASSSSGQSDLSSSAMTPSRSWQRSAPPSTFVNGRGNVQHAAPASHYVPHDGGSTSAQGTPMLGAPVQQQGQQAYVRRDLSPVPSIPRCGSAGSALPLDGAAGETAAVFLPNQFGVRQRVAIKTSSRPPAPRSSLTPQRRSSAMSTSLSAEGRAAGANGDSSPHARSPSPSYYPPPVASSRSASLHPPSPHATTPTLGSTAPTRERSPSPSPSTRSGYTSTLDLPRPRTSDPNGSVYSLAPSRSPSPTVHRSSFASSGGGGSGTVTPTPSAPSSTQKTSLLDRPRPKTPDSAALFRFGENGAVRATAGPDESVPPAPEKVEERPAKRSVLDRPRPRTPDSQAWLDSAATSASSRAPFAFGAGPSSAPLHGRFAAVQHHRPSGSGTTTSGFSSSKGGSFDSIGPTALSASTRASTTATSARPSLDSGPPAPLLDFNFDFGSSFGTTETMFGLSDLLKLGPSVGVDQASSVSASRTSASGQAPARTEPAPSPALAQPTVSASAAESVPHTRTASAASSGGTSGFLSLPGTTSVNGRATPRKEPPKVDLQLELELEIERALPPHRPLAAEVPPRASSSSSFAGTEGEVGRRAPRGHASVSSIESTAASGRSASVSGGSVFSMGLNGGAPGSSPRPKRRRRKSLASLLSFGSFSQSGHGGDVPSGGSKALEGDGPLLAGKVQLAPPILPPVAPTGQPIEFSTSSTSRDASGDVPTATSTSSSPAPPHPPSTSSAPHFDPASSSLFPPFGELSLDKSLPPTPAGGNSSAPSAQDSPRIPTGPSPAPPDSPTKRSFGTAVDAANKGLTRQLSKLRNRGASSSSSSDARTRNPNFQLISATTTRRPSQQHDRKPSISSLRTSDTHASRRSSLDHGSYHADGAPASSGRTRTETSSSAPVASSAPFGRRLVDRLTKGIAPRPTAPAAHPESWTMPVRDHSDEPAPARRMGRRRGSFSSLLGVGTASADGHGAATSAPKKILGMSLPSGRRSDDLLTSGRGGGKERADDGPTAAPDAQRPLNQGARRSFDLLKDRVAVARRPSTDNLISLATAKLSSLAVSSPGADISTASPSAEPSTVESAQPSTVSSGTSTPDDDDDSTRRDKADTTIEIAAVVRLPEASPVLQPAPEAPAPELRPSTPRLLARSDSLKGRRPLAPAAASAPAMPARPPVPSTEPVSAPRPSAPAPAPPRPAPPVVPIWRRSSVQQQGVVPLEKRMTRAWLELEDALEAYCSPTHDRVAILKGVLLPFLWHEEEKPSPKAHDSLSRRHRRVLFGWMDVLMTELEKVQERHRGTCLESLAALAESHLVSYGALEDDPEGQRCYRSSLLHMLGYAVEKLDHKAVYANILTFSSRVLALAFFRIDGVALKLLRALPPVKQQGLRRIMGEAGVDENNLPPVDERAYPVHLSNLCLRDYRAYAALLVSPNRPTDAVDVLIDEDDIKIEMTGNWLVRWKASDSDLSYNFYRAYHRQLADYLLPSSLRASTADLDFLPASVVVTAPGYLFLAASLLEKIDSLVHRSLRTFTSLGPASSNFNTNDSANLSFGQKPKVLEHAQRRVVTTLVEIVGGSESALTSEERSLDAVARRYVFGGMLQVWVRACVKRTSLWDVRGVYLVADLIESLLYKLAYCGGDEEAPLLPDERSLRLFDLPFLFGTVRVILEQADNTVTIMRTIALVYANFDAFTTSPAHRTELCEKVILDENLFRRLLLHWNSSVRNYWIRLLVWRLSRLGKAAQEQHPDRRPDADIVALFSLLNVRLEAVRKRHDELEPRANFADDSTLFRPKRSTICSTRGVNEAPWTVGALGGAVEEESDDEDDNAQELVRSTPPSKGEGAVKSGRKQDLKTVAKVVSWLKGGLGKKQDKGSRISSDDTPVDPFLVEQSDPARSSTSTDRQHQGPAPLPTTVETGCVPTPASRGPHTPDAPTQYYARASASSSSSGRRPRPKSGRAERRRSLNPAFFAFDFDNAVVARTDVDPTVASSGLSAASVSSGDTAFPSAPIRPRQPGGPAAALSPRVSLRFSKRISILPPAALDLLKEAHGSEPVPPIPARYRDSVEAGYERHLHTYAVLGLRDYEDALDEWTVWTAQLDEEEGEGRATVDVVPRLAVSWPLSGSEE
ncbi:uncharacterized protein RHOBADRAFT_51847 [Rhodotorula graminis WP1]|uniref:Uncharacterized protein n=1 Tax=Rhodotorula graminis (strain WP1) TaxID=578459 RepID=A0A194S8D5_RHOGW|nr:uncharacterized protein RHOBADRAFT_51847 [Rhodotorula graminis WP1]KPV76862.1 hypothetical protein RHOBADRAFT_51847 [Rhodotorula graminis WP1]